MKNKENIVNGFNFSELPITIQFVGEVNEKEWSHFLWNVTIKHSTGFFTIQYKTGKGLIEKAHKHPHAPVRPKLPTNSDIMYSLLSDSEAADYSFNEWCDNYGYNNDSMKAFKTYQSCCEEAINLKKAFTRDQLEEMKKALEDY